ncbi:methyltransferase domain-containing protein [Paenibacillus athensensis]|uniref:HTH merR-type domain-containing protein n=1 Tax=Paenibacillus athensensis TaxID=1967502 RepID=A0A4Y8Q4J0_9BACL|nr:MerR family transcriptional regulator [Paenibacillus athensensis]MCD1258393.1 methyltransferase domain-containing protein [Paenibacillus athensensis]
MLIQEAAQKLNISPRAIRLYEQKGLISPAKQSGNQYRIFTEQDLWRLQTITALREAGMSLEQIKCALEHVDSDRKKELLAYLEMQRSIMYVALLAYKQQVQTTESMISLLKKEQTVPLQQICELAAGAKKLRETRTSWHDVWNFDHMAAHLDDVIQQNSELFADYGPALRTLCDWIRPAASESGLDAGTGTGNLTAKLLESGCTLYAVDQSPAMLAAFGSKFPHIEARRGNLLALPFMDGQFDFVVSSFALHHLNDEQTLLALTEIQRVLRPKGRIGFAGFMFTDRQAQEHYYRQLQREGRSDLLECLTDKPMTSLALVLEWLEQHGYMTKHRALSELVHVVAAVPIR